MSLEIIRLLFDFGLVVLIWLVQLVIYPSFKFYQNENLLQWHKKYTVGISVVVMPLMLGQLGIATFQLFEIRNAFTMGSMLLITLVWAITFLQFVPMHGKIAKDTFNEDLLDKLVHRNWWRTLIWTLAFIWNFITTR